jgi:DnaK suppressor protein
MFTKTDLLTFRKRLHAIVTQSETEDSTTRASRGTVTLDQQSVGRLSRMDALQQQAMAKATHARRQAQIVRAKAALLRIENGEFGFCLECGEDIARKRLDHDPSLAQCITCASG